MMTTTTLMWQSGVSVEKNRLDGEPNIEQEQQHRVSSIWEWTRRRWVCSIYYMRSSCCYTMDWGAVQWKKGDKDCANTPLLPLASSSPAFACHSSFFFLYKLLQMLYNDIILYQSKQRTTEGAKKPQAAAQAVDMALCSAKPPYQKFWQKMLQLNLCRIVRS